MSESKRTLVFGASPNPQRYAYLCMERLRQYGHEVLAFGLRKGEVANVNIDTELMLYPDVHTVTMYMGELNQEQFVDHILKLQPKRIIFNPGAENPDFMRQAAEKGVSCVEACTLVMLSIGSF